MSVYDIPESEIDGTSPFGIESTRTAAYTNIRREIEKLEGEARIWKKHYNTLSFSCHLPPEILAIIFEYVARAERGESYERHLKWIARVSHICTYWRKIALDSPRLWADIPLVYTQWVPEMIKRAKTSHLTVEAELGLKKFGHTQELLKHLQRVQNLAVLDATPTDRHSTDFLSSLSDLQSAPLLETCQVCGDMHAPGLYPTKLPIIPDQFLRNAPKLRSLRLELCIIKWTSPLLNNRLTTLELVKVPSQVAPTVDELVSALDRTPNLQNLVLSLAFHKNMGEATHSANLPHLQYLEIDADYHRCLGYLRYLSYPRTTSIKLHLLPLSWSMLFDKSTFVPAMTDLGGILGSRMDHVSYLAVKNQRVSYFKIKAWDFDRLRGRQQSPSTLPEEIPSLNIHMNTSGPQLTALSKRVQIIGVLFSAMPIHKLQTLAMHGLKMTANQWVKYFGTLDSLESLRVAQYGRGIVGALSIDAPRTFKNLKRLVATDWQVRGNSSRGGVDVGALILCLRERRECGMGIRKLRLIERSNHWKDNLPAIRVEVEECKWDNLSTASNESKEDVFDYSDDDDDDDDGDDGGDGGDGADAECVGYEEDEDEDEECTDDDDSEDDEDDGYDGE